MPRRALDPKRPTIHDVASAAGVSVTTVSDALNGKGRVDPATRTRVAEVVKQLGYRANRHARGLRLGRSGAVGLLLPVGTGARTDEALSLDFYMRLASAAATTTFAHGQALMLIPPRSSQEGVRGFAIDGGIIVDPAERDARTTLFGRLGLPVVTIERDLGRVDERWYVATNADANTRTMLDHLAARGATRIALLLPRAGWGWATETRRAYEAWTREHAAEPIISTVPLTPADEGAFTAASRLLSRRKSPDAIFVAASRFIRGSLRAASELGRDIPGSLLLGAGVDSVHAREGDPRVTALDLHPEHQAEAAVEMLLARLAGRSPAAPCYIDARLEIRASTGG